MPANKSLKELKREMRLAELPPLQLKMDDACVLTNMSRNVIFEAVKRGHLRTHVVGRSRFTTYKEVTRWVEWLQKQSDAGKPVGYTVEQSTQRRLKIEARP